MFGFLDRLRQRPPAVRKRFALASAVALTGIVTLIWLVGLPARFSVESSVASAGSTPFASMGTALREQWSALRQSLPVATTTMATSSDDMTATTTNASTSHNAMIDVTVGTSTSSTTVGTPVSILIATSSHSTSSPQE